MNGEDNRFLEACEASGPLQLEWNDWETGGTINRTFPQASIIVGRNPAADLCFQDPSVGKRHAYLQMIEGRLYAIDLDSRQGLRWSGVPRRSGWIDRQSPMQLGPTTIRLVSGDREADNAPGAGPLSRRYVSRHHLPAIALTIRGIQGGPKRLAMNQPLTLVGSSPTCHVRLTEVGTSLFACALVRTLKGIWMIDLLSSLGVTINGFVCRHARVEDGDTLQVGGQSLRLNYEKPPTRSAQRSEAALVRLGDRFNLPSPGTAAAKIAANPANLSSSAWELIPEIVLRQLQGQDASDSGTSAPLDQALMLLVRLLGEIHRDQLGVLREEMEQIRRLNGEMRSLVTDLPRPRSASRDSAAPSPEPKPSLGIEEYEPMPLEPLDQARPALQTVQTRVTERLAEWERERQSRWRRVMALLVKR